MDGQFMKPLVIGKSAKPRCFRNLDNNTLPVTWKHNKKAWMTSALFAEWMTDFNRQMRLRKRKVLLFLDNAPSHPKDNTYSNVKLHFFPANTTSKLQPLDQGIIKCVKSHYRKRLLRKVISMVDRKQEASLIAKDITVYDACLWISQAQKSVSEETVQKCFARCGFKSDPDMDYTIAEFVATDPELTSVVEMATTALSLDNPMTADEYVTWDEDTPSTEELGDNWEEELLLRHKTPDTATTTAIESDEETEDQQPVLRLKTHTETLDFISQCELFGLEKNLPEEFLQAMRLGQDILQRHMVHVKSQARQITLESFID